MFTRDIVLSAAVTNTVLVTAAGSGSKIAGFAVQWSKNSTGLITLGYDNDGDDDIDVIVRRYEPSATDNFSEQASVPIGVSGKVEPLFICAADEPLRITTTGTGTGFVAVTVEYM